MISIAGLHKKFGQETILRGIDLDAPADSILTLLGPSGSGKSTLLRCVAGLETPDAGEIRLGSELVFSDRQRIDLPPERRHLGMVFQSYAVWPHMSVAGNVAYPLRSQHRARAEIERRVGAALRQVGLDALAGRGASDLSGGQQQRVALARAIVAEPALLLLDEPLSNLDARLRAQMRVELAGLRRSLGLTMLYVTHDQEEALALADRIALMRDGQVIEVGTPAEMYERPRHRFTAEFLGLANFLPGTIADRAGPLASIDTAFGRFTARAVPGEGTEPELFFRPHQPILQPPDEQTQIGEGIVSDMVFLGETLDVTLRQGDHSLRLRLHPAQRPQPGERLRFALPPDQAIIFLPPATR